MNHGGDEQMRNRCVATITPVRASSGQVRHDQLGKLKHCTKDKEIIAPY